MAITASDITFTRNGKAIPSGSLNNVFADKRIGSGTDYAEVVITNNNPSLTLTGVKVWLSQTSGASVAIGYANAPISATEAFDDIAWTAPTYSSPTSKTSGIAIADIGPGKKVRIFVRRNLNSSTTGTKTARIYVGGTSPI